MKYFDSTTLLRDWKLVSVYLWCFKSYKRSIKTTPSSHGHTDFVDRHLYRTNSERCIYTTAQQFAICFIWFSTIIYISLSASASYPSFPSHICFLFPLALKVRSQFCVHRRVSLHNFTYSLGGCASVHTYSLLTRYLMPITAGPAARPRYITMIYSLQIYKADRTVFC